MTITMPVTDTEKQLLDGFALLSHLSRLFKELEESYMPDEPEKMPIYCSGWKLTPNGRGSVKEVTVDTKTGSTLYVTIEKNAQDRVQLRLDYSAV